MTTLTDVAKKANVSKMTVSRVINHPEQVTDELKELVYAAMKDLNYKPNRLAKALANQRTQMVKLFILEDMESVEPYYMNLLIGIASELDKHSYGLQFLTAESNNLGQSDGYIICGMRESDFENIKALEEPVVLFGENSHGYDFVDSDNKKNIEIACEYCLERGYDKLVYIEMDIQEPFSANRRAGYMTVTKKFGIESVVLQFKNDSDDVYDYITQNIDQFKKNTAFICASDRLGLGVVRALKFANLNVPEDFGVIGHDGVFLDQISYPKLTTIQQDVKGMGEACARLILQRIKNKNLPQKKIYYPSTISKGGSIR